MSFTKILLGVLGASIFSIQFYVVSYCIARLNVFHTVENYPQGKGGPRQDYIAKIDQQPGQVWEYQLFLPAIKLEETIVNYSHKLKRQS